MYEFTSNEFCFVVRFKAIYAHSLVYFLKDLTENLFDISALDLKHKLCVSGRVCNVCAV